MHSGLHFAARVYRGTASGVSWHCPTLEGASMADKKPTQQGDAAYRHIKELITDAHQDLTKTLEAWKPE